MRRAESVLSELGFSEGHRSPKALWTHAKTSARNNVQIVDKGNEFPHDTEDLMAWQ